MTKRRYYNVVCISTRHNSAHGAGIIHTYGPYTWSRARQIKRENERYTQGWSYHVIPADGGHPTDEGFSSKPKEK